MIPELEKLGFTRNEANVYLASLKLGKCSVQQLAQATGIKRLTVHSIVEKFETMQIFVRTFEGKRRKVSPVEPKQLKYLIEREEEAVFRKGKILDRLLPDMEEMFARSKRGFDVKILRGEEGFMFIGDDILSSKTEYLEYGNNNAYAEVCGDYLFQSFLPRKHKIQLKTKFLYPDTPECRRYIKQNYLDKNGAAPMEVKFIPIHQLPADDTLISIYDQKVGFLKPSTMTTVIIKDSQVSAALRAFFNLFWENFESKALRNY